MHARRPVPTVSLMDVRIVMVDPVGGGLLTEDQLDARLAAATAQLRRHGLREGDNVIICLPVGPDLLVAVDSVIAAGGTAWPVPAELDSAAIHERILASGARVMISDQPHAVEAAEESRVRVVVSVAELGA